MPDTFGMAYYFYDEYARDVKKNGEQPVSFWKFLLGRR